MKPSKAQYILRFDDICPTMNWRVWGEIEDLLIEYNIKPIIAIVPDNQDPELAVMPAVTDFWARARAWQARGWAIALHGFQHVYVNKNPGIIGVTPQSEFAGLSRDVQREKLCKGLEIFANEKVVADCWVAPSHSFDWTTVELLAELGVKTISDGLWPWPHTDRLGITWVPQQLWNRVRPMKAGIWTVCQHHNSWRVGEMEMFRSDLEMFSSSFIDLKRAVAIGAKRRLTPGDRFSAWYIWARNHRIRPLLIPLLRPGNPV